MIAHQQVKPNAQRATKFTLRKASSLIADIDIPSKPSVLKQLDNLGDDIKCVSALIAQDPALSAAVLKVINCAWFALPNHVQSIEHATLLLGLERVRTIVRAVCFKSVSEKVAEPRLVSHFWKSSLDTAICASTLSRYLHLGCKEAAYALGLFHNCGIPVLSSHFRGMEALTKRALSDPQGQLVRIEREQLGVCHSEIGFRVAKAWGLSDALAEAILQHHAIKQINLEHFSPANHLVVLLKLAEYISDEPKSLAGVESQYEWREIKERCLDYASLKQCDLDELKAICLADMHSTLPK